MNEFEVIKGHIIKACNDEDYDDDDDDDAVVAASAADYAYDNDP
jgi:hypothetical protein